MPIANWFVFLCLAFSCFASFSLNTIVLYFVIPIVFIISFAQAKKIITNKYLALLIILFVWEAISSLWATNTDLALSELRKLLGVFLICYIFSVYATNKKMLVGLYLLFLFLYISAWIYASTHALIVTDFSAGDRLNNEHLNANTMAYYTTNVSFSFFIISEIVKSRFWKIVFRIFFLLMIPMTFWVALMTASRQVLIIQIPLFIMLLWNRYYLSASAKTKTTFILIVFAILICLTPIVISIFENSFLAKRSEAAVAEDSRAEILQEAIEMGIDNFPIGVGAGNFIMHSKNLTYSHNAFAELFANSGIVGLVVYMYLFGFYMKQQWIRYRKTKDRLFVYFLVFGVIFLLYQFFYMFYTYLWAMAFFMLIATHSNLHYNQVKDKFKNLNQLR